MSKRDIMHGLDSYIEFANNTKRFSDAGFYEAIKDEIKSLQSMLAEQANEWISIDKAPKDGNRFWLADSNNMRLGFWSIDQWADFSVAENTSGPRGLHFKPTHFRTIATDLPEATT
jgi:hypothetical protein